MFGALGDEPRDALRPLDENYVFWVGDERFPTQGKELIFSLKAVGIYMDKFLQPTPINVIHVHNDEGR